MFYRISEWWRGEQIYPSPNELDLNAMIQSPVVSKNQGPVCQYKRPLLRRTIEPVWAFWLRRWEFIVGTFVAIALAIFFGG
jgi:hypothetical protein